MSWGTWMAYSGRWLFGVCWGVRIYLLFIQAHGKSAPLNPGHLAGAGARGLAGLGKGTGDLGLAGQAPGGLGGEGGRLGGGTGGRIDSRIGGGAGARIRLLTPVIL